MTSEVNDIVGKTFGRLTVLELDHIYKQPRANGKFQNQYYYKCQCSCENKTIVVVNRADLTRNTHPTRSCGCLVSELGKSNAKHGMSGTKFYNTWQHMKQRCNDPNYPEYQYYGARGITIDPDWNDNFMNFYNDMYDSYQESVETRGERNTTLERTDVNKGYCKDNCEWTDYHHQNTNKQNTKHYLYKGSYYTVTELYQNFAENISYTGFRDRINKLYKPEDEILDDSIFYILTSPIRELSLEERKIISEISKIQMMNTREELLKKSQESN